MRKLLLLVPLAIVLPACDPCFGVSTCAVESPAVSYQGEIFDRRSGRPVAAAEVTVVRRGGVALERDSFAVRTNERGEFVFESVASDEGEVVVDMRVTPPSPMQAAELRGVTLIPSRQGDVRFLQRLYVDPPYLPYLFEVYERGTNRPISGGTIWFRRISGIAVEEDMFWRTLNAEGKAWVTPVALEAGELVAQMGIDIPGRSERFYVYGVKFSTTYDPNGAHIVRLAVGQTVSYTGRVVMAGTGLPSAGVDVEVRRTGGLEITPGVFRTKTDAAGNFTIDATLVDPFATGEVIVDMSVLPSAPYLPLTISDVRLAAFAGGAPRPIGEWTLEAPWYVVSRLELALAGSGAPVANADVEFERTGGVATVDKVIRGKTDASGAVRIALVPLEGGEVIGRLRVTLASGAIHEVSDIRLAASERAEDVQTLRLMVGS